MSQKEQDATPAAPPGVRWGLLVASLVLTPAVMVLAGCACAALAGFGRDSGPWIWLYWLVMAGVAAWPSWRAADSLGHRTAWGGGGRRAQMYDAKHDPLFWVFLVLVIGMHMCVMWGYITLVVFFFA